MAEVLIRNFEPKDRPYVRELAWNTAFFGKPADVFFGDKELLVDILTLYFTDYEPDSCFVAEDNGRVVGYLLGARDTATLDRVAGTKIAPRLLFKSLVRGTFLRGKNISFAFCMMRSLLKGEFRMPDFSKEYPATLHINLEEGSRNLGAGSKLISSYLEYLLSKKVPGVYLPTLSDKAAGFFRKQGFNLLYEGRRSYFRNALQKDVPLYIYAKKLPVTPIPAKVKA